MSDIIEIKDYSAPELDVYARLNERQLTHLYEPAGGIFIAESPNVIARALDAGYEPVSFLTERRHIAGQAREILARCPGVPVYTADLPVLEKITGFKLTRGVLCAMKRRPQPGPEELIARFAASGNSRIAVLEEVQNPTNVGAIFRSAAALGMDAVLLTGGCSDPLYRRSARVSMGTVFQIPWTFFGKDSWPEQGMAMLRGAGYRTAALALRDQSVSIADPALKAEPLLAAVLGTEGEGLRADTIADCDYTVKIPMSHGVDSLNVAAASAVAFWELRRR